MPDLSFDGKKISVAPGTNLVEAGLQAGVPVPVFCYHKDLGAVGSCRVCAVTVTAGGKERTVMACMTEAADGMDVTTLDPTSVGLRKRVLEWLMINHPHDCPICDEGGECQLQDLTIAAGHGVRRYTGRKRVFENQFLGEFIQHEMNRCIACYRCSRFYQEVAGGRDFGVTGSRDRVYFGRYEDGPLESPFSGNLVEMCPTGVFTDKLFRYKTRVWDLEIAPSVCPHCSVGCNVHPGSRMRELQRVRVRANDAVNGSFMCDRGQFGHRYVEDQARPRTLVARGPVAGAPAGNGSDPGAIVRTWEAALGVAGGALLAIARERGAASVAFVTSARASVETHAALQSLAAGPLAGVRVAHFDDPEREARTLAAVATLAQAGAQPLDQADISQCDVLLVAGASLVDEAPLAALAARQAARRGARVFVLNIGERYLSDVAEGIVPIHPAALGDELVAIALAIPGASAERKEPREVIAAALAKAQRPGVLLGTDLLDGPAFEGAGRLAQALRGGTRVVRMGFVLGGPNAFGAAAFSTRATLPSILSDLETGRLAALVAVEADPSEWGAAAISALGKLELLITLDHLPGPLHDAAHLFGPTTTTYESHGTFVNRAGRAQGFAPSRVPGEAVPRMIDAQSRFPRQPRLAPPASDARDAWWALELLRESAIGTPTARSLADLRGAIERGHAFWQPLREAVPGGPGVPLDPSTLTLEQTAIPAFTATGATVFRADRTLGSEVLSRRSPELVTMAGPPVALVSATDAARWNGAGRVAIDVSGTVVEIAARGDARVAPGLVLVPRDVTWPARASQGTAARVGAAAAEEVRR